MEEYKTPNAKYWKNCQCSKQSEIGSSLMNGEKQNKTQSHDLRYHGK